MGGVRYSDEDLINVLKSFYVENGKVPLVKDFQKRKPDVSTFTKRFGSWKLALEKAGLTKDRHSEVAYTKDELIRLLQKFHGENGKVPTVSDLRKSKGYPTQSPFERVFGSYKNALIEADLLQFREDKNLFGRINHTPEELKYLLKQLISEINRVPIYEDIDNSAYMPSSSTYIRNFGSLTNALNEINFKIDEYKEVDNDKLEKDMLKKYVDLSIELNRTPTARDVIKSSKQGKCYSLNAYNSHFESLNKVNEISGLPLYYRAGDEKTKEELINDLVTLSSELNRTLIQEDVNLSPKLACVNKYVSEFGSWPRALELAGMSMNKKVFYSTKGVKCLSIFELKFTNMLERYEFKFTKEVPYSKLMATDRLFRFDFVVEMNSEEYPIEIFGYVNNKKYDKKTKLKKSMCKNNDIALIELYPTDFRTTSLEEIKDTFLQKIITNEIIC